MGVSPSRTVLEDYWRERVSCARIRYLDAQELLASSLANLSAQPDSRLSLQRARDGQKAALEEYRRDLQIFNDLILRNRQPVGLKAASTGI